MSEEQELDTSVIADPSPSSQKNYDLSNSSDLYELIKEASDSELKKQIALHIKKLVDEYQLTSYRIVLLYDDYFSINHYHSNKIYEAVSDLKNNSDILMILLSDGGRIEPAYLISKTCQRLAKKNFAVSIPRRAKSAATLISLGANEIHMGLLSELGPIDPQIGGFPALGLANALEKIAALSAKFPDSSEMFAKYLTGNLDIKDLGLFERINESATQYAERLLSGKNFPKPHSAQGLADHFTNHYKDHGFVIDADEASRLLGNEIIKEGTKEYELGNAIYKFLELADLMLSVFKEKTLRYVGSIEHGMDLNEKKRGS
jgi:ClpP class serine protease